MEKFTAEDPRAVLFMAENPWHSVPERRTALVHRRWVCHATAEEFAERFCASVQMLGSDLFAFGSADDPRVQEDYKELLLKKLGAHLKH